MAYKPVNRIITIEFRELPGRGSAWEVVVTDDYAVVRSGDTIEWDVQGAPPRAVVTVGNFTFLGTPVRVTVKGGRVHVGRAPVLRDGLIVPRRGHLVADTGGCAIGVYKYDVLVDGKVVLDPDVEIRGPKGY